MGVKFDPLLGQLRTTDSSTASSPLTTKGDIYGYSTTNARIPIGVDGYVLTADSTQTLGLKWTTTGSSNFIANPSFETDYTGWTNYGTYGTIARDNTTSAYGSYSSKQVNTIAQDGGIQTPQFVLQPGTYSFSVWAKLSAGVTNASMVIRLIGPGATQVQINQTYPGDTGWHKYGGTFTVAAQNTYEVLLGIGSYGTTSGGTVQYDWPVVQEITFNAPTGSGSGITRSINTVTTTQAMGSTASTDYVYHATGTITLTLPAATSTNSYKVMNYGTGVVTIAAAGSDTIVGSASVAMSIQNMAYEFISDGISAWGIF